MLSQTAVKHCSKPSSSLKMASGVLSSSLCSSTLKSTKTSRNVWRRESVIWSTMAMKVHAGCAVYAPFSRDSATWIATAKVTPEERQS